jgi:uncharacterized membrane protein
MNPLLLFLILLSCIITALYLGRVPYVKQLSSAMIVIILTAILANIGLIPTSSAAPPLYDGIFKYIAPMAIFYLMLSVNLKSLKKAGLPMIGNFFLGAVGIMVGVAVAMWAVQGADWRKLFCRRRHVYGDFYRWQHQFKRRCAAL